MIRAFKSKKAPSQTYLTLPLPNDQTAMSFPGETVEQIRYMLARVQQRQPVPRRLAVVSALSGEGVTYMAYALGATIANDMGARTCIVDLNWHRPFSSPLLQERHAEPQIDLPEAELAPAVLPPAEPPAQPPAQPPDNDLSEYLYLSGWTNLALFHIGPVEPDQRPVLARSRRLSEILDTLANKFDHLILDVPAVLSTSDSVPLAMLADSACLVVRHGVTQEAEVRRAISEIRGLPVLGTILNQVHYATPSPLLAMLSGRA